jgi:hypothetical protein
MGWRFTDRDTLSALFMAVIGVLFCLGAVRIHIGSLAAPGNGFFPFLVGAVLILLSFASIMRRVRGREVPRGSSPFWPHEKSKVKVACALGAILVYALIFEWVGFAAATFILLLFLLKTIDPVKWKTAFSMSFLFTLAEFLLFQVWLKAQLPEGWISWWRISRWIF